MNTVVTDAEVFAERPLVAGPFEFRGPGGGVAAGGAMTAVARGSVDTLDQRVAQAFAQAPAQDIIGGALPFRRSDADYLFCAKRIVPSPQRAVRPPEKTMARDLRANPSASRYGEAVAQAVALMRQETGQPEALRKIVLARTLELQASDPIAVDALLERLGEDDSVTAFRVALPQRSGRRHSNRRRARWSGRHRNFWWKSAGRGCCPIRWPGRPGAAATWWPMLPPLRSLRRRIRTAANMLWWWTIFSTCWLRIVVS